MTADNLAYEQLVLNRCLNTNLKLPRILFQLYESQFCKKAIVWDLDETCNSLDSPSPTNLFLKKIISENSFIRENKESLFEYLAKATTKEDFSEEEKQLGNLFADARLGKSLCYKAADFAAENFKLAGGLLDTLYELHCMRYTNFLNSGSPYFVVCRIAERRLAIDEDSVAGSFIGFDENGIANGVVKLNLGKNKAKSEEELFSKNGFSASGLEMETARVSDDVVSDKFYHQHLLSATINLDPFLWISDKKSSAESISITLPPETRQDMSSIPKIIRRYEFGRRLLTQRNLNREKELTKTAHKIQQSVREIFPQYGEEFTETKNKIISHCREFLSDGLNRIVFGDLEFELAHLENTESEIAGKIISQKILDKLAGSLELNVESDWLDNVQVVGAT